MASAIGMKRGVCRNYGKNNYKMEHQQALQEHSQHGQNTPMNRAFIF